MTVKKTNRVTVAIFAVFCSLFLVILIVLSDCEQENKLSDYNIRKYNKQTIESLRCSKEYLILLQSVQL